MVTVCSLTQTLAPDRCSRRDEVDATRPDHDMVEPRVRWPLVSESWNSVRRQDIPSRRQVREVVADPLLLLQRGVLGTLASAAQPSRGDEQGCDWPAMRRFDGPVAGLRVAPAQRLRASEPARVRVPASLSYCAYRRVGGLT